MNRHPVALLEPVFRWLDWLIAEHGHYIYLVMVWTSPFLIVLILGGVFCRKRQRRPILLAPVLVVPIASPPSQPVPPPLPPSLETKPQSREGSGNDMQSFSA